MVRGNYRHFVKLFLRGQAEPLIAEVRSEDIDRLRGVVEGFGRVPGHSPFLWFDTVDGKSFAISLRAIQAVHFLCDPTPLPPDPTRYEGPIIVALRGRKEALQTHSHSPEQVSAFFMELDSDPGLISFPGFEDEDGELLLLNAAEIVYVMAPLHLLEDGSQMLLEEPDD